MYMFITQFISYLSIEAQLLWLRTRRVTCLVLGRLFGMRLVAGMTLPALGVALSLSVIAGTTLAQALPTNKALEEAMTAQRDRSAKITSRASTMPSGQMTQTMPNIDTSTLKNADPTRIVEQYQTLKDGVETAQREEGFLIFVSLSMPKESLNRLVDQAVAFNAPLVIRGTLNDSLAATVARVTEVLNKRSAEIQIDPRLFTRFQIASVPAFVAITPENGKWGTVLGDVTAAYALETMERSMPGIASYAKQRLASAETKAGGKR